MAHHISTGSGQQQADDRSATAAPEPPMDLQVRTGRRWIAVTWQAPSTTAEKAVAGYRLSLAPGDQTFRFPVGTTSVLLIALASGRSYTVSLVADNAAGTSEEVCAGPIQLPDDEADLAARNARAGLECFADLLGLDDATLAPFLTAQDDADLTLALATRSPAGRARVLSILDEERADVLRRRAAALSPTPTTALVRRGNTLPTTVRPSLVPPGQPPGSPADIVIEVPPVRRRWGRLLWVALLVPLLLGALYLVWRTPAFLPAEEHVDLEGTVEALVAVRLTAEHAATPAPARVPVLKPETNVAGSVAPTATSTPTPTPVEPVIPTTASALYAEPAVALVNVRSGPGQVYPVRVAIPAEERVQVTGRNQDGSWVYVESDRGEGWVAGWLLTLDGVPTSLAVRPAPPTPWLSLSPTPARSPTAQRLQEETRSLAVAARTPVPSAASQDGQSTPESDSACAVSGHFQLFHPVEITVHDQVTFRWGFSGTLPASCGFEVRMGRVGEVAQGVHDAVADNHNGVVKLTRANEYRLTIPYMHDLPSVQGRSGDYYWTVAIVQIEPAYADAGRQAQPARFYLDLAPR